MSLQYTDTIRFRRYVYELLEVSTEEGLATPAQFGLLPEMIHTACYRGFYLRYSLTKRGFCLRWMTVRDKRGHYPPIGGVEPIIETGGMTAIYRDLDVPVPYTGGLRIGRDPIWEEIYQYGSIAPQVDSYQVLLEVELEEGRLVRWRDVSTGPVVRACVW